MFAKLRACDPTQSLGHIILYRVCRKLCALIAHGIYRASFEGREKVPAAGAVLVISNHQSHLDPVFVGVGLGRRNMASIAREGLFKVPGLGMLLRGLGSISIKQDEGDAGAIRAAIGELKRGRVMLMFPEGTRTPDGAVHDFKRGAWLLISRSGCVVLPAAVEGVFDAWPRTRKFPRVFGQRCAMAFGEPIPNEQLKALGADAGLELLTQRVDELRVRLRARLRAESGGRRPRPGPGDVARVPKGDRAV